MAETTIFDARGGVIKAIQTSASDPDVMRLVTTQDVDPVITYAREMAANGNWSGEMKPAAEIPMVIVEQLMQSGVWDDPDAMKKWLNDPANDCFRIWRGRV